MKFYGYKNLSGFVHRWKVQVFPAPKKNIIVFPLGDPEGGDSSVSLTFDIFLFLFPID